VIVWSDADGAPVDSWERPDQVLVDYDELGRARRCAIKAWVSGDLEYATLYTPTELWKFQRAAVMSEDARKRLEAQGFFLPAMLGAEGGWVPRETSDEQWPLPNPLGVVPVVEVLNRPQLGMEPVSEIDVVMAMQDTINVAWSYLLAAADHASMEARVVLGAEPPKVPVTDEAGNIIAERPAKMEDLAKGRLLFLPNATGIGQWTSAKSDYFLSLVREAKAHIAAKTGTPGHYLLTNDKMANLNGEALTAAEVPLVMKCKSFQTFASPSIKEVQALNAQVRGQDALAAAIRATESQRFVQWKDPAMHSLAQVADASTKDKSNGLSLRTILERRYEMTDAEIDQEMDRIKAEKSDPILEAALKLTGNGAAASGA
jgi:hypothetical protein